MAVLGLLCLVGFFVLPKPIFVITLVAWLSWSVYSLKTMNEATDETQIERNVFDEMKKNDRGKLFSRQISIFEGQQSRINDRLKILNEFSEGSYTSLGEDLRIAITGNFEKANNYIHACDFADRDSINQHMANLNNLCAENENTLDKINELINQLAEIENSTENVDTKHIDDLLESLRQITSESQMPR